MRANTTKAKAFTLTLCIIIIGILGVATAVPAQAAGHNATMNPPLWYEFNVGRVEDQSNTRVTVTLDDQANCGGRFFVLSGMSVGYWDTLEEGDWIGVSTSMDDNTHAWAGELVPGRYFVRLGSGAHMPCVLGVAGEATHNLGAIDLGQEPEPVVFGPTTATNPAPAPSRSTTTIIRNTEPMTPGKWMHLTNGEPVVMDFRVGVAVGNDDDNPRSIVTVQLNAGAHRSGEFQVFDSTGNLNAPQIDQEWIGCSCEKEGQYPSWQGELVPGGYRVRIFPHGAKDLMLSVSGEAVQY